MSNPRNITFSVTLTDDGSSGLRFAYILLNKHLSKFENSQKNILINPAVTDEMLAQLEEVRGRPYWPSLDFDTKYFADDVQISYDFRGKGKEAKLVGVIDLEDNIADGELEQVIKFVEDISQGIECQICVVADIDP